MNCSFPTIGRPRSLCLRGFLLLSLVAQAFSVYAQNPPRTTTQTNLSTDRLLVILDISSGMQKRAENMQRIIAQMFSSGFDGQLRRGDTIGVWTFNDSLHTGEFPLQRWSPQSVRQITSVAAQFAQNQRYSKQASLLPVMAQLTNVVADSDRITVVIVSDGSAAPAGTPFDAQIDEAFKLNSNEQRRQAMPFVTILRAVKGEFIGFKVNTPPWPIEYPAFPPEPVVVAPQPINPPVESPKAPAPVASPEPKPTSVVITNPPPTAITNPPLIVVAQAVPVEPVINPVPTVTTNLPAPVSNVAQVIQSPTNAAPASAPPPTDLPVEQPVRDWSLIFVVAGGIALCGLAIICLALWRNSRQPARVSLITRSMNKDQK